MANKEVSFNLGIGSSPETEDEKIFPELVRIYNAINSLAVQLDSYTGSMALKEEDRNTPASTPAKTVKSQNTNRFYAVASVDLAAGDIVNAYNDAGTVKFRKAYRAASPGPYYWGCGVVMKSYSAGANAEAFLFGLADIYTGLSPGDLYWLSATPGSMELTYPAGGSGYNQCVGVALSGGAMFFRPLMLYRP